MIVVAPCTLRLPQDRTHHLDGRVVVRVCSVFTRDQTYPSAAEQQLGGYIGSCLEDDELESPFVQAWNSMNPLLCGLWLVMAVLHEHYYVVFFMCSFSARSLDNNWHVRQLGVVSRCHT